MLGREACDSLYNIRPVRPLRQTSFDHCRETGATIQIAATNHPKFKRGISLESALN